MFIVFRVVYITATAGVLFAWFRTWSYDDPYITYRYAANLADGLGFVYNLGELVLSTTSPLFALLLAGFHLLGADIPTAANLLGAVGVAAGGLLLWDFGRRLDVPVAGWACAVLYPTSSMVINTLGSETPVYLALCLAAASAYFRRRYTRASVLLGLAVLARADALIFAGLLASDWLIRTVRTDKSIAAVWRAVPFPALLAGPAVVFPWVLFALMYFGKVLPTTLAAKQAQGLLDPGERFLPGLGLLVERMLQLPHNWFLLFLIPAGLLISIRVHRNWLPILLWPVFFSAAYTLLGVTRYPWYYASLLPGLVAAAGLSLETAIGKLWPLPTEIKRSRVQAIGVAVLGLITVGQVFDLARLQLAFDHRVPIYREVGLWLAENTSSNTTIATLEVGIMGFYSRPRPMIDFAGILQPEIAARFRPGYTYGDSAVWVAEEYRPDVFVIAAGSFFDLHESYLAKKCKLEVEFRGVDFEYSRDMLIYVCG